MYRRILTILVCAFALFLSGNAMAEFYFYPSVGITQSSFKFTATDTTTDEDIYSVESENFQDWYFNIVTGVDNVYLSMTSNWGPDVAVKDVDSYYLWHEEWSVVAGWAIGKNGSVFAGYQYEYGNIGDGDLTIKNPGYLIGASQAWTIGNSGVSFAISGALSMIDSEMDIYDYDTFTTSTFKGSGFGASIGIELGSNFARNFRAALFVNAKNYQFNFDAPDDDVKSETTSALAGIKLASRF